MRNEGEVLRFISSKNGCLLSDISSEFQIPICSVKIWVDIQCCTGYIRRCGHTHGSCACSKSGLHCVVCTCMQRAVQAGIPVRLEVTEKGHELIENGQDEKNKCEPVKPMEDYLQSIVLPGNESEYPLNGEITKRICASLSSEGRICSKVSLEMVA